MKFMMFAALAAAVAMPALAQTTPATPDATQTDPAAAQPAADPAATAPATTPDANASMATPAAPTAATGSYPKCSRTVTDQCTERSNAKGERLHSTPRPHKK